MSESCKNCERLEAELERKREITSRLGHLTRLLHRLVRAEEETDPLRHALRRAYRELMDPEQWEAPWIAEVDGEG